MSKNETKEEFNFIDFLRREFGLKPTASEVKIKKAVNVPPLTSRQRQKKLNWLSPQQPRNLGNVLDIKLGGDETFAEKSQLTIDIDDESVSAWHNNLSSKKKHLLSQKSKKTSNKNNAFSKLLNQPHFNTPGILSYCREDNSAEEAPHWFNKALALVFAVFILAIFSSAYIIDKGVIKNKSADTSQAIAVIKPDRETLANYIRVNNEWLEKQFNENQDTVAITAEDLFGKVAGAAETTNETEINNSADIKKIEATADDIRSKLYNYFKNLQGKQAETSYILSNTVANIFSR